MWIMKAALQVEGPRASIKVQGKTVEKGRERDWDKKVVERMLAHWRKLAGASHIGISCHVDPARPLSLFLHWSRQFLRNMPIDRPLLWSNARLHYSFIVLIILLSVRVRFNPPTAGDAIVKNSKKPNVSTRKSPAIAQAQIKLQAATCV